MTFSNVDRPDRFDEQLLRAAEEREEIDGLVYQASLLRVLLDGHSSPSLLPAGSS